MLELCQRPEILNMVMTFTLTPLSHYNFITKPRARFLLSLLEDLSIDFPSHLITSIIDVYQDTATYDKLIFPSAIMWILRHFSIPIPLSPLFTTMGAISIGSVRRSEVQLQMKRHEWSRQILHLLLFRLLSRLLLPPQLVV